MKLKVENRTITGKKVKLLRKESIIPAVIYGKHTKKSILISFQKNDFLRLFKKAGKTTPITLEGEGIDQLALVHTIDLDPVTDFLSHVDFLSVRRDEKVTANIPLILTGESSVEKLGEGKVSLLKDTIEVEAFPQDLPHEIIIDISAIVSATDVIFVKDLNVGKNASIQDDMELPVVTVITMTEEVEAEVAPDAAGNTPETTAEAKK